MNRPFLAALLLVSSLTTVHAQMPVGSWRTHFAMHDATDCARLGDRIYVLSDGSLYSYHPDDEGIDTYDKTNLLSDQGIAFMQRCETEKLLMLVYRNANIDLLTADGSLINMPDWHDKSSYDPTVNDVYVSGSMAYLSANFGIVAVNLKKREFANTYPAGTHVLSTAASTDVILAATPDGVRMGHTSDNLLDAANWHTLCTNYFNQIVHFKGQFVALSHTKGLYLVGLDGSVHRFLQGQFSRLSIHDNTLTACGQSGVLVFHDNLDSPQTLTFDCTVNDAYLDHDTWWAACGNQGLRGYAANNDTALTLTTASIIPDSPVRNYCDYLTTTPDERLLVAGGCLDYFGTTSYPGTLELFADESWTAFQEDGIAAATGLKRYSNITSIVQDPTDPTHHYASAYGEGIYEFKNGQFVANLNNSNSKLETVIAGNPNYTRISRLQYGPDGNLWITNSHAQSPVKVLSKDDGNIHDIYYPELKEQPTVTDILFHSSGLKWVVVMRADAGLFGIDDGGTPLDTRDDRTRFISPHFADQDGNSTTIDMIYDIAEDKRDGSVWVLTNKGPYVIKAPKEFFNDGFTFTKIKVSRNDGTNIVDYLLDGVYTTCIAIDAAGRKWIGTQNSGIYLIDGDDYHTLHHFTAADSPLPSDAIKDIAILGSTGEVFIATEAGLVSFRGEATDPADEYVEKAVYAFPNPVEPDYTGVITVVGLKADSDVRIIATDGSLVSAGHSLGGSYVWDGCTSDGRRVPTGIYHVLAADAEGHSGIITHIVIAR